jgi:hypothetical protein
MRHHLFIANSVGFATINLIEAPVLLRAAAIRRRTDPNMSAPIGRGALAIGLAGALTFTAAIPAWAAAVPANSVAVKSAAPGNLIDVRWRGRYYGGAVIGGVAAGLALGAIAASRPYYYAPGYAYYGYASPYYAPPSVYAPPPVYYAPEVYAAPPPPRGGPYRQCWVQNDDRGFGYWRPC